MSGIEAQQNIFSPWLIEVHTFMRCGYKVPGIIPLHEKICVYRVVNVAYEHDLT